MVSQKAGDMCLNEWMELFKKIEELENGVTKEREKWMQQGSGSGFSYYLYQRKLEGYQQKWNDLLSELAVVRLKTVQTQAMINRDDFPEEEQVTKQAEQIIQEAECLLDYCTNM